MRVLVLLLVLSGAAVLPAHADPLDVPFNVGVPSNVVNIFTNGPGLFSGSTNVSPAGWSVHQEPGGQWVQFRSTNGSVSVFGVQWLQDFTAPTNIAYQTMIWNYGTQSPTATGFGSYSVDAVGNVSVGPGYAASGGPTLPGGAPAFVAPVPEPSSVLIGAVGLGLMGLRRWRRGRAASPA